MVRSGGRLARLRFIERLCRARSVKPMKMACRADRCKQAVGEHGCQKVQFETRGLGVGNQMHVRENHRGIVQAASQKTMGCMPSMRAMKLSSQ